MSYLDANTFANIYEADIGMIVKVDDSKSKFNNKLIYIAGDTFNGYCYKDYNNFKENPDEVCYIAECDFDSDLFVDYVYENKERLIQEGGIATANSIKEELRNELKYSEYYYEYQKNDVVHTIEAKDFDDEMINNFAEIVFEIVDWQTTQAYICETDWSDNIANYYEKKLKDKGNDYGL